ncbi:adenosine receptor A1-like [Oculina patagonica]
MDLNNTESTSNSSNSTFHCPHSPMSWDLNVSTFHWLLIAMALVASPLTILLNAIVILVMKQRKELQKTSNILLSSMAVTDLLVGVIVMPLSAIVDLLILSRASFAHKCMLDLVTTFVAFFLFFATLYHLTIIAWERYVAIQKWMDYKIIVTNGRAKKLAIAAWLCALFAAIPVLIFKLVGVDHRIVESWFTMCALTGEACLIFILFFYRKVYLGIRQRKLNEISQVTVIVEAKLQSKVAKTTGLLTAALMFSFIPSFGLQILGSFFPVFHTWTAIRFTTTVTQLNSLFNPLLYWYRDRRFRNGLLELLGKQRKPQVHQPAVDAARFVRRQDPPTTTQKQNTDKHTRRLARSASCNAPEGLDSMSRRPREKGLKRSFSARTVNTCSSSSDGLESQQPSSIMTVSATIHVKSSMQRKARKNNCESTKDLNRPRVIRKIPRSESHSIPSVKFSSRRQGTVGHQATQNPNERPKTAPATFIFADE